MYGDVPHRTRVTRTPARENVCQRLFRAASGVTLAVFRHPPHRATLLIWGAVVLALLSGRFLLPGIKPVMLAPATNPQTSAEDGAIVRDIAPGRVPGDATPHVLKPEVQKPEVQKPEVQDQEVHKQEVQKQEVRKQEVQKQEVRKQEVQDPEAGAADTAAADLLSELLGFRVEYRFGVPLIVWMFWHNDQLPPTRGERYNQLRGKSDSG